MRASAFRPGRHGRWPSRVVLSLLLLLSSAAVAVAATPAAAPAIDVDTALDGFDEWVESIMEEWLVPGLGVSIVKDGEVILARGYGLRDFEGGLPATENTLFAIGSNSKSFTAAVLGILVDNGTLDWETPVRDYLPDFRLYDETATEMMTPRDLVSHTSGLPRHDLVWLNTGKSRRELFELLRYLEPSEPFRSRYQYQNLMFMTAGYLAGQVTGSTWEEQVRELILEPLGMTRSGFSVEEMQKDADFSYPHMDRDRVVERIPFRNIDAIGPAGSINSSALEMTKWVQLFIDGGKIGDKQVLSEATVRAMTSPQMVLSGPLLQAFQNGEEIGDPTYGLGLAVGSYRGHKHVRHGGGIDGFISAMEWLPNDKIGVVVLSNTSGSGTVPQLVVRNAFDRLLGYEPIDWAGRARKQEKEAKEAAEKMKEQTAASRKEGTTPSHALADYAAAYEHPAYGVTEITLDGDRLVMSVVGFDDVPLEHFHYDIFAIPNDLPGPLEGFGGSKVHFHYNNRGDIDRVAIPLEPAVEAIVFERQGDASMNDPAFLAKMVGAYELSGIEVEVELVDGELQLTVPGQPTYTLEPDRETTFILPGVSGYSVRFLFDEGADLARAVEFTQPNGTFVAERKS